MTSKLAIAGSTLAMLIPVPGASAAPLAAPGAGPSTGMKSCGSAVECFYTKGWCKQAKGTYEEQKIDGKTVGFCWYITANAPPHG